MTDLGSIVPVEVPGDGGKLRGDRFTECFLHLPAAGDATQISFLVHPRWVMA